jgi:hypothetical protein
MFPFSLLCQPPPESAFNSISSSEQTSSVMLLADIPLSPRPARFNIWFSRSKSCFLLGYTISTRYQEFKTIFFFIIFYKKNTYRWLSPNNERWIKIWTGDNNMRLLALNDIVKDLNYKCGYPSSTHAQILLHI